MILYLKFHHHHGLLVWYIKLRGSPMVATIPCRESSQQHTFWKIHNMMIMMMGIHRLWRRLCLRILAQMIVIMNLFDSEWKYFSNGMLNATIGPMDQTLWKDKIRTSKHSSRSGTPKDWKPRGLFKRNSRCHGVKVTRKIPKSFGRSEP